LIFALVPSPIGSLVVSRSTIRFRPGDGWTRDDDAFPEIRAQLDEWFGGERRAFDLDLDVRGTPFQQRVWAALESIPYGSTATYRSLVEACGGSARAVGAANGANPYAVVIPCHRLVGTNGSLTGYAGGLPAKRWLLDHEAAVMAGKVGSASLRS
jgi:methylated-DNA-[protein]-cysteine S-methyltransferase